MTKGIDPGGWAPYLDEGEILLWTGAPATGLRLAPERLPVAFFGVFFFGFAIFWTAMAARSGSLVFPLFGAPFLLVGFHMVVGQFIYDAWARGRTRYALTDRRAIIATETFGRSLRSYPIDREAQIEYRPGEEATINFAEVIERGSHGRRLRSRVGFRYIRDGEKVYRLLRRIRAGEIKAS